MNATKAVFYALLFNWLTLTLKQVLRSQQILSIKGFLISQKYVNIRCFPTKATFLLGWYIHILIYIFYVSQFVLLSILSKLQLTDQALSRYVSSIF